MNSLAQLCKLHEDLRVFSDDRQTRLCIPVASSEIIFDNSSPPSERSAGEIADVIEGVFGGKFQLPVETTHTLEATSGRSVSGHTSHAHPIATIEVWSLEPGSYDLVLRLPNHFCSNDELCAPLVGRFVDQAHEVARTVDNLDLLRFHGGPSLSLKDAQQRLNHLERDCGTRLDTENLLRVLTERI